MTAPAKFLRITKRTRVTAPCVLARQDDDCKLGWDTIVLYDTDLAQALLPRYAHWLPIEFPEVRG